MKNNLQTILLIFAFLIFQTANAQVTVVNANVNILAGTTVTCLQYFTNQAPGVVALNGTLDVNTDVTNDGSLVGSGGTSLLRLTGTTEQLVAGTSTIILEDFQINNVGNDAVLSNTGLTGAVRVSSDLFLTSGRLFANDASPIVFTTTANNPAETNANHIVRTAIMEARVINAGAFPLFLNLSMLAGSNLGNVRLERRTGHATGNTVGPAPTQGYVIINGNESIDCYWTIIPTNIGTALTRDATFSWLSVFDNSKDLTQMQLWRTFGYNYISFPWYPMVYPPIPMLGRTHTMTIDNILNSWTFSDITHPLPVELIVFQVKRIGEDAALSWKTAHEINAESFDVQRSFDGENFETVGTVKAQNKATEYGFKDEKITALGQKILYYRLKQNDSNGNFKYSAIRSLQIDGLKAGVSVYPVPFSDNLIVNIQNPEMKNLAFRMTDDLGREVFSFEENAVSTELNLNEKVKHLPAGTYFLNVTGFDELKSFKLVKN